jgi:hypothetical protein
MKDFLEASLYAIIGSVTVMIILAIAVSGVMVGGYFLDKSACKNTGLIMETQSSYSFAGGCFIKYNGQFYPLASITNNNLMNAVGEDNE